LKKHKSPEVEAVSGSATNQLLSGRIGWDKLQRSQSPAAMEEMISVEGRIVGGLKAQGLGTHRKLHRPVSD